MKNVLSHSTEYTRKYSDFLGVDLSGNGGKSDKHRFSYAQNMYKDYEIDGQTIESVPGYRCILSMSSYKINGIYTQITSSGVYFLIHAGARLHRVSASDLDALKAGSSILSMPNKKSTGYAFGTDFYILDGSRIIKIDNAGAVTIVGSTATPYVPTTYYNAEAYEQRNLLSDNAIEKYDISSASSHTYGTPGLVYSVVSEELGYCAVVGAKSTVGGKVMIPAKAKIGGNEYKVVKIAGNAFHSNTAITEIIISEGVEEICTAAFMGCSALTSVKLPTSMKLLGASCFSGCNALKSVYAGYGLISVDPTAFSECGAFTDFYYEGGEQELNKVENADIFSARVKHYYSKYQGITVSFRIFSDVESVDSVSVNGIPKEFTQYTDDNGSVCVALSFEDRAKIDGACIEIEETLTPYSSNFANHGIQPMSSLNALSYCTIAEKFDGKIFLSGNPYLPNTVFYTSINKNGENDPLYIGEHNYFNDGVGQYTVTSLLCVRDSLTVFKSGDDGTGSIFYHTKKETGDDLMPAIYPVSYVHSGICALSGAINFLDDPVFLTSAGLVALQQNEINYERSIAVRSHNVNRDLLKENLKEATLLEWQGYLCVCVNGKIFLADSRAMFRHPSGNLEYEWFVIDPIGSYQNDKKLYRYDTTAKDGYTLHEDGDKQVTATVYSSTVDGVKTQYVTINGVKYNVYSEGERYAGVFKPAHTFATYNDYLLFGADTGGVFMFNNDKRGVPPTYLSEQESFDADEYKKTYGKRLHPSFYSFADHAPRYCLTTVYDDCDIPHLTKSTVKNSLVIRYKSYSSAKIVCEIGTDNGGFSQDCTFASSGFSFDDVDFSNLTMAVGDYFTIPISEKEKNWIEKQINVYSEEYNSPIGICSITYRYTIHGRIKQN